VKIHVDVGIQLFQKKFPKARGREKVRVTPSEARGDFLRDSAVLAGAI
jgi:hypothetical protein